MTKDELWVQYVAKNPSFGGEGNVTLSTKGLKKLFDQTWERGYKAGGGSLMDDILGDRGIDLSRDKDDLFNGKGGNIFAEMFGGGKKR